jgi:uncharacterized damage-inducible protein DinB
MDSSQVIQRLHQHRAWVNQNLLEAATSLSETVAVAVPIGQGSIWKSLVHLYAAEYVWLEALLGDEEPLVQGDLPGKLPGNQMGEKRITSLQELKTLWTTLEQRWAVYLSNLNSDSLDDVVYKKSSSALVGNRFGTRRSDILLHVCTHAQYTTAQIVNMLRQCEVEKLPDTMLILMARQEAS